MRWFKKQYQGSDQRLRQTFLFWPRTIGNETRWLEWAQWVQVAKAYRNPSDGTTRLLWIDREWIA